MPLSFPASPTEGQTYSYGDSQWVFTSGAWVGTTPQGADMFGKVLGTAGEAIAARQGVALNRATGKLRLPTQSVLSVVGQGMAPTSTTPTMNPQGYYAGTTGRVMVVPSCSVAGTIDLSVIRDTPTGRVVTLTSFPGSSSSTAILQPGAAYLGAEDKWAIIYHHTTTILRIRMVQVDPNTGAATSLSVLDVSGTFQAAHKAAFGGFNPTTGTAFVGYEDTSVNIAVRKLTFSGTTITAGAAQSVAHGQGGAAGNNICRPTVTHSGQFSTVFYGRSDVGAQQYVVLNTGGGGFTMSSPVSVATPLYNSGNFPANLAINGKYALLTYSYNNSTYHAPVFLPGYVNESGGYSFRDIGTGEWTSLSPNTEGHRSASSTLVVPSLDEEGVFYVLHRDNNTGLPYTRKVTVTPSLGVSASAPTLAGSAETLYHGSSLAAVWTGYELYYRAANNANLAFVPPRGMSGQELIGIAATSAVANATLKVYTVGAIVPGYTGLTPGGMCYVHSGGNIDQSNTYDAVRIGRAVSATEILVTP